MKLSLFVFFATSFFILSCGKKKPLDLPLVTPPVKAATPQGFQTGTSVIRADLQALSASDFKSRFFSTGPTYIFSILQSIDNRISDYNTDGGSHGCSSQTPVAYTLTPWGQSVTMYGQCVSTRTASFTGDPGLTIFGVDSNKVFYLYDAGGASWTAAIATPITGQSGKYSVHAWIGVGYSNGQSGDNAQCAVSWDNCSYAIIELTANQVTQNFEMVAAGMGVGYCGAQYVADGTNIYGTGSTDNGTSCGTTDTICVSATDASTTATCTTAQKTFSLTPIGRKAAAASGKTTVSVASWGASAYPTTPNATLDGTSTDALRFGPTTAPAGIGTY